MDKNLKEKNYSSKEIELTALDIIRRDERVFNMNEITNYWDRYNSTYKDRFDYLTKIGEFDLPMQERNVPLQRRLLDLLVAKKSRRPFNYSLYLDSKDYNKEKYKNRIRQFVEFAVTKSEIQNMQYERMLSDLDRNLQTIQNNISKSQGNIPPEDMQKFSAMMDQFNFFKRSLEKKKVLTEEYVDEFNVMYKMSADAIIERLATKYLKYLERVVNFNYMSTMQFRNRVVTGHHNYIVASFNGEKPVIKPINISNVVFQTGGMETSINKKDWAYYVENMSFAQILENFGEKIQDKYGSDALMKLRDLYSPHTQDSEMWALPNGGAIFASDQFNQKSYNYSNEQTIEVKWVWFRGSVPVSRKTTTDKKGIIHKHILPSKKIINKDDFAYNKGYYINKKNPSQKFKKKDVAVYSKKNGDKIETKNFSKLYHAIVINDEYVINEQEWKTIVRDVDNYNRFNLPIFGKAYDSQEDQPYSLIKATNDIQDLIDIVWISREYMIAVAGTKGNVIDVSQKPDDMTTKEWEYHMKMGRIYIQTVDENGVPKRTSFNQWQNFDNSVSQAITYYDSLIENLSQMMGSIIGIPYQALGETTRADQVGTNKMAIQESQMVTEMLFYEHFMIDKEVLEEYVSLSINTSEEKEIIFTEPNISSSVQYTLNTEKIKDKNIKMNLYSTGEDFQRIQEIKQMTSSMIGNLGLSLSQIMKIWNSESLKEMEARVEYFEEKAKKVAAEQAKASKEEAMATFKETKQFETEMEVYLESVKQKYKEAEVFVKQAALEFEKQKFEIESQLKLKDLQIKNKGVSVDAMKVIQDNTTERSMLLYDDKHQTFDNELRALELQINTMFREIELGLEARALGLENKKINIEDKKVSAEARKKPTNTSYSKNND